MPRARRRRAAAGRRRAGTVLDLGGPAPAEAQTPKRGGIFRLRSHVPPVHFDPHQTIAFSTMIPLSFAYSRLVKVKAGPVGGAGHPARRGRPRRVVEPANDTTYVFKLRKGVRWHNKPPVNGRELTAEDVKYTYERFLTIKGNGNEGILEQSSKDRGAGQVHRPLHVERAERVVPGRAGLHRDLDRRQGMRGEVTATSRSRIGRRHRALDARALRAGRAASSSSDTRATSCPGFPMRMAWRSRSTSIPPRGSPPSSPARTTSGRSTAWSSAAATSTWPSSASPELQHRGLHRHLRRHHRR